MKKKVLIILLFIILTISIFIIIGIQKNSQKSNVQEANNTMINSKDENTKKEGYIHTYFDTSKFDKTKFSGIMYDQNKNSYKVTDLLSNSEDYAVVVSTTEYTSYYFTQNIEEEREIKRKSKSSDKDLEFIKDCLGDPTCIYENYYGSTDKITGDIGLIYDYDNYVLVINLYDYSLWEGYSHTPMINTIYFLTKETWFSEDPNIGGITKNWYKNHKLYGEEIK